MYKSKIIHIFIEFLLVFITIIVYIKIKKGQKKMGFQSYITAARLRFSIILTLAPQKRYNTTVTFRAFYFSMQQKRPLKTTILSAINTPIPSKRFNACIKIQKITRGYLTRRTLATNKLDTNDQLKAPQLCRFFENIRR